MKNGCNIHYPDGYVHYRYYSVKPFIGYKYGDLIIVEMIEDENGNVIEVWVENAK